jgi:hypothetical protein
MKGIRITMDNRSWMDPSTGPEHTFPIPRQMKLISLLIGFILVSLLVAGCQRVRDADDEYEEALAQIETIQIELEDRELYELTPGDMVWLEDEFETLSERVDRIQDLSSLPFGLDGVAERGSARYRSMIETLEVAQLLAEAGQVIANIGHETLTALEDTGVRFDRANDGVTWLEVLQARNDELDDALALVDEALAKRARIDEEELPNRVRANLDKIDAMTERFASQIELADELPLAYEALGAEESRSYLVLFQNPAELRPTGGFVGTIAELELHRGQIVRYEFHDVYELSRDYRAQSDFQVDPPWAIRKYVRPDDLQIQDANWWAHFPISAELLIEMTEAAGWHALDGVVALQPETIQQLITVTGPLTVDVDGEDREITAENLHDEAERQRRIRREGGEAEAGHKEVIELIGDVLLDEISTGDRDEYIAAALLTIESLDRRDMQVYHEHDEVQAFLEERNWAGLLEPEHGTPTISVIFANITGLKTSLVMQPEMSLELAEPDRDGTIQGTLSIALNHEGAEGGDPFYEGFQRWWVDVSLPEEAADIDLARDLAEDPDASNGGAYIISLYVGEREEIVIDFTFTEPERLLIRRQPGLLPALGTVAQSGCNEVLEFNADRDIILVFEGGCPYIETDENAES